eukprot:4380937-Alexandrium_andersonii.AAC.1
MNIIGIARCLGVLVFGGLALSMLAMCRRESTPRVNLYKKKHLNFNKKVIVMREYAYEMRGA